MLAQDIDFIINILRQGSIKWPGRSRALKRARKIVYEGTKKKLHWQCSICKNWFRDIREVEVDHIKEVGPFSGDWNDFMERLFCEDNNLQVLCVMCHAKKTSKFNAALKNKRKVKNESLEEIEELV